MISTTLTVLAHPMDLTPAEWGLANVPAANAAAAALGQAAVDAMAAGDTEAAWNVVLEAMLIWTSLGALNDKVFELMHCYIDSAFPRDSAESAYAVLAA